jgi:hypothetical protein
LVTVYFYFYFYKKLKNKNFLPTAANQLQLTNCSWHRPGWLAAAMMIFIYFCFFCFFIFWFYSCVVEFREWGVGGSG